MVFAVVAILAVSFSAAALTQVFAPPPEPWSQFPGVPQVSTDQVLKNDTVDELEPRVDAAMAAVRAALTERFGFVWVAKGEPRLLRESNRYWGESLLFSYDSVTWQTTTTLRTESDKHDAVALATSVMEQNGFPSPTLQNVDGPAGLAEFGGFTLQDQGRWVLSSQPPQVSRGALELIILDLAHDRTGALTAASSQAVDQLGWEPEYLSISYSGNFMLREADRAEFERRAELYKGHIAPVPGRNTD